MTGRQLRRARERAKVSLRALARFLALSPSYLSDLELGRRTSQETIKDAGIGLRDLVDSEKRTKKGS